MKNTTTVIVLLAVIMATCLPYAVNAYKLYKCDFGPDYKCEAIHAIGVAIPPASLVTVWISSDT